MLHQLHHRDGLGYNAFSICNWVCGVQSQLLSNICKRNGRVGDADVAQPSPDDIVSQLDNRIVCSVRAESAMELLSNGSEELQVTNSNSLKIEPRSYVLLFRNQKNIAFISTVIKPMKRNPYLVYSVLLAN
ncbi:hypothetical protein SLA2020_089220 [Shorea laevis]